jgi:plasmid stability protein
MFFTCDNVNHMSKMVQVRNVPDELHRTLKIRAAQSGKTLSDYLLAELEGIAEKPTLAELAQRISHGERSEIGDSAAELIRGLRGPLP